MAKFKDLSGMRFGKLVVLEQAERSATGRIRWNCKCDCGNEHIVHTCHLNSGSITDCGCEKSKRTTERNLIHGDSRARLYNIWIKMRDRCSNPKNQDWELYGGKGVTVCDEWNTSYESFRTWSYENGYDDSKTIDRISSDGNYCPENCRWTTSKVQANNTSRNHFIEYHGEKLTIAEASERYNVPYGTLKRRISNYGWPIEKAIETPVIKQEDKEMANKMLELVDLYKELLDRKEELAEQTKANNKEIETIKNELTQMMIEEECASVSRNGYKYSLQEKVIYSKRSEEDLAKNEVSFFDFLRDEGMGDIIKETVDSRTLSSTIKSMVEEVGELPEHFLDYINTYETMEISKRKETNSALKK